MDSELMQNGRAHRDAPLVFAAIFLVALICAYWASSARYDAIIDQKNATVDSLQTQLNGSQDQIKDLREQAQRRGQSPPLSAEDNRQ